MDLDELQSVRDRERQTDKLQQLRETFYEDAGEFIQQLRDQRERAAERADDPFDAPEVNRLSDEIDTAEQTVEAIYEKRVGKIVKAASFAAADMPAESDGMTAEEQDLFETLVADIKANRQHVMDVLAGETDDESEGATDAGSESQPTDAAPADHVPDAVEQATDDSGPSPPDDVSPQPAGSDGQSTERSPPDEEPPAPSSGEASGNAADDVSGADDAETGEEVSAADVMGASTESNNEDTSPSTDAADGHSVHDDRTGDTPSQSREDGQAAQSRGGGQAAQSRESSQAATPQGDSRATPSEESEHAEAKPELRNDGGTGPAASGVERETVRITADVGDIFGVDEREYDLAENDVVQLPAANAEPLVERDAAERLD